MNEYMDVNIHINVSQLSSCVTELTGPCSRNNAITGHGGDGTYKSLATKQQYHIVRGWRDLQVLCHG